MFNINHRTFKIAKQEKQAK